MKAVYLASSVGGLTLAFLLVGCGHKQDAKTQLEKAATAMAQGNEAQPAPPPAPAPAPEPAAETPAAAPPPAAPTATPAQQVQQALAAYKSGQMEDAVTRLHRLRATPTLTAEQRMALQDSIAAVMAEVYALAEKGDTRAIAAVRQYEQMQSAPR